MNKKFLQFVVIAGTALALQGCSTGYNRALVTNNSNIGLDLDTSPPKIEAAISSSAGLLTPTFEGGQTLPVMSSISTSSNGLSKFFFGLSSTVVAGDAAYSMSYLYADCNRDVIPVSDIPDVELTKRPKAVPGPGEVKPAIFITNTMVGANIAWSRSTPLSPSSIKLGFNRQEEVSTPITVEPDPKNPGRLIAGTPSFLATIDHWIDLKKKARMAKSGRKPMKFLQYFAVGDAATNLALRSDVRQAVFKRITPYMTDSFCEDDYETKAR